ncbi:MAG: insulinase family protein [Elusimicrobia bacterium]|nr:insulinase family protein [Elusimicrobiota bacterium]
MKFTALIPCLLLLCAPLHAGAGTGDDMTKLKKLGAEVEKDAKFPPVVSYTMKNGLRLLILEKKFVPTVSFTMIFRVGNVDGLPGKTGLAHLFEHMAFKGTKTINSAGFSKEKVLLEKVETAAKAMIAEESKASPEPAKLEELRKALAGAEKAADALIVKDEYWKIYNELGEHGMNAMTSTDYTGYIVSLPSNRLEAWMIIESDRFKNAVLREFYRERSVVMEERRMGESDPNRLMWETLFINAFAAHPYHNPTIGWMDDLKRLTRTDADQFFKTFYAPNNATLAVVGDIKPEEVIKLAEKYFASWKKRPLPERNYTKEQPQKSEKRINVFFKAKPSLRMGFHNTGWGNPDIYGLLMLSEILSNGKTSRFYKNLVEGKQLALYANSGPSTPGDRYPSLFVILAAPKAPHTVEEVEDAILEEIDKLKKEPPTPWEMEKVINNYEASLVRQLESNSGLGMSLASNQQILGDWKFDWKVTDELRKLKPEDVSRVAGRYFTRDNKTIVFLREPDATQAAPPAAPAKGGVK